MIDWLSAILPVDNLIDGGAFLKLSPDGEVEKESLTPLGVGGSFSSTVQVCNVWRHRRMRGKSVPVSRRERKTIGTSVYISGNPAKYLQGHNVYGTDNVNQLAAVFFETVARNLGFDKDTQDLWYQVGYTGAYEPTRIDITYNYRVEGGSAAVNDWIRAAHTSSRVAHKNASSLKGNTLYFGKHSRRHTIKMYNKFEDLLVHKPCPTLMSKDCQREYEWMGDTRLRFEDFSVLMDRIYSDANGLLRVEQTFRAKKLRDLGFDLAKGLDAMTIRNLFNDGMQTFSLTAQLENKGITKESVGRGAYMFYLAWLTDQLNCSDYPRTTIHNNRKKLLPFGVDITLPRSADNGPKTVPLIRTLEAIPVEAPSFYYEHGLLAAA